MSSRYTVKFMAPCWVVWDRQRDDEADTAISRDAARKKAAAYNEMARLMAMSDADRQTRLHELIK